MSVKSWFDGLRIWVKLILIIGLIILYPVGIIFIVVYLISWAINFKKSISPIANFEKYIEKKENLKEA